jgi:hypothetical protein
LCEGSVSGILLKASDFFPLHLTQDMLRRFSNFPTLLAYAYT